MNIAVGILSSIAVLASGTFVLAALANRLLDFTTGSNYHEWWAMPLWMASFAAFFMPAAIGLLVTAAVVFTLVSGVKP